MTRRGTGPGTAEDRATGTYIRIRLSKDHRPRIRVGPPGMSKAEIAKEKARLLLNRAQLEREYLATPPFVPRVKVAGVYFIEGAGLIKIGFTTDVAARLRKLRNSSPVPLELLHVISSEDAPDLEAMVHGMFAAHRRHGEWFTATEELRAFIQKRRTP